MITFVLALGLLIGGYFIYGSFVEKVFGVDPKRPTPAQTMADGVDFVALPTWKVYLIQFLNIAGLGPIFGAIMGIMFGPAAFLWIVFGTIFAGAVHDFLSGMLSLRRKGASLPEIVGSELGGGVRNALRVFSLVLMVLVGAVFIYNPADLLAMLTPEWMHRQMWIFIIFAYYMAASLLPIDKLIGRIYPVFGAALLFMAAGILVMLLVNYEGVPELWHEFYNHSADPEATPIFPMMFVSIACGAISGFHATQSPMMARCMTGEKHGRMVFYGAMVTEGVVALIWAAAAIAFTGGYAQLHDSLAEATPAVLVNNISTGWLGTVGGVLAVLGVIAAPITTGDTALRSARLIAADMLGMEQKTMGRRLMICIPLFVLTFAVMMIPYQVLWRYFAWCNQVLSVFILWALTVWLMRKGKPYLITAFPAMFMTVVTVSYILFAPEGLTALTQHFFGFAIPYYAAIGTGLVVAALFAWLLATRRPDPEEVLTA